MKTKQIISLIMAVLIIAACFAGCKGQTSKGKTPSSTGSTPSTEGDKTIGLDGATDLGFASLDSSLVQYLKQSGYDDMNFAVSPLSYKAALAITAMGAEGDTQKELLDALGFSSEADMIAWYEKILTSTANFPMYFSEGGDDNAFKIANSIWANTSRQGRFVKEYVESVGKTFQADAKEASAEEITDSINDWAKAMTNGLIPHLIDDASDAAAILVNALYLKTAWDCDFHDLGEGEFTTKSGTKVKKDFITTTHMIKYYKDDVTELAVIPLQGGLSFVVVLGDETNIREKIKDAEKEMLYVKLPAFDVETAFNHNELCSYLGSVGCGKVFTPQAELSRMFTSDIMIGNIIQKSKVHVNKDGIEAAAATAVVTLDACEGMTYLEAIEFFVDHAFSFYIIDDSKTPELLFYGQIVQ